MRLWGQLGLRTKMAGGWIAVSSTYSVSSHPNFVLTATTWTQGRRNC